MQMNTLFRGLIILVFCSISFNCVRYSHDSEKVKLPEWFWKTPRTTGVLYAVGYSDPYEYPESSFEEAFNNAAERLWYDRECRIINNKITIDTPGLALPSARIFKVQADTNGLAEFKNSVYHLDSAYTESIVVVLVGTAKTKLKKKLAASPKIKKIDRIKIPKHIAATLYTEKYAYETSSWMELEAECRRKLANLVYTELSNQRVSINEGRFNTTDTKTDIRLSQIQTIYRAIDKDTGARWIKIAVPISNIQILSDNFKQ